VAYTGYNPVVNPVFLARNRMHGDPRFSKTEKKRSKEYSIVFLVEGEKINLGEKN